LLARAMGWSMSLFEPILAELNRGGVRYVVVGGLATVLQGYARLTADVDLVVDLEPREAEKAIRCLTAIGLKPRIPVPALDFADPEKRQAWIAEKNMKVFPLVDPDNPMRLVDLFVEAQIDFEGLWRRSDVVRLEQAEVRIACISDLVALKRAAGRAQDLIDIEVLEKIAGDRSR